MSAPKASSARAATRRSGSASAPTRGGKALVHSVCTRKCVAAKRLSADAADSRAAAGPMASSTSSNAVAQSARYTVSPSDSSSAAARAPGSSRNRSTRRMRASTLALLAPSHMNPNQVSAARTTELKRARSSSTISRSIRRNICGCASSTLSRITCRRPSCRWAERRRRSTKSHASGRLQLISAWVTCRPICAVSWSPRAEASRISSTSRPVSSPRSIAPASSQPRSAAPNQERKAARSAIQRMSASYSPRIIVMLSSQRPRRSARWAAERGARNGRRAERRPGRAGAPGERTPPPRSARREGAASRSRGPSRLPRGP